MLILLPPSEAKSAPSGDRRLDLDALSFPTLTPIRRQRLDALIELCRDEQQALDALRLRSPRRDEVLQNRSLRRAPADAAVRVYTGVLYEALDAVTLSESALHRLQDHVAISSALWGLVRPLDPIPAYRLSAGNVLPGSASGQWRHPVAEILADVPGPVIDLRSGAYRALAPLPAGIDGYVGNVLLDRAGRTSVVSHANKATKGRLLRAVARSRRRLRSVDDLIALAHSIGLRVEIHDPPRGVRRLDLIATSL